jgi:hypothetical protein
MDPLRIGPRAVQQIGWTDPRARLAEVLTEAEP